MMMMRWWYYNIMYYAQVKYIFIVLGRVIIHHCHRLHDKTSTLTMTIIIGGLRHTNESTIRIIRKSKNLDYVYFPIHTIDIGQMASETYETTIGQHRSE